VLETEPAAVIAVDNKGLIELVNRRAEQLFGYKRSDLYGEPIETLVPDETREAHLRLRNAFLSSPTERAMGANRDLHGRRKDGSAVPIEVGLTPLDLRGVKGALATVIDISQRKIMERRQEILTNEVRHRSRNLLTVVKAIAMQTVAPAARTEFMAALDSLARTQDLFLSAGAVTLAQIVESELAPFHNRMSLSGCNLQLSPRAAQDFALILHELGTNSAKYGALSVAEGRVAVSGEIEGEMLTFIWDEQGGPRAREPARKGFGQTILIDMPKAFANFVEARYGASGFQYELRCLQSAITSNVVDLADRRSG